MYFNKIKFFLFLLLFIKETLSQHKINLLKSDTIREGKSYGCACSINNGKTKCPPKGQHKPPTCPSKKQLKELHERKPWELNRNHNSLFYDTTEWPMNHRSTITFKVHTAHHNRNRVLTDLIYKQMLKSFIDNGQNQQIIEKLLPNKNIYFLLSEKNDHINKIN
ncbi:hypothetical protein O3M35_007532 [Rhynocoris fuscipes]|uniref:Uncharacterized protein n=1 Tax=Rhynocoris fuscipes TaxID=488301 RepID=A0AAW1D9Y4_9HEMI